MSALLIVAALSALIQYVHFLLIVQAKVSGEGKYNPLQREERGVKCAENYSDERCNYHCHSLWSECLRLLPGILLASFPPTLKKRVQ